MDKKEVAIDLGLILGGVAIGTFFTKRKYRKRIAQWQPLMGNAFLSMLMKIHSNPDITPEEIREHGQTELAFMRIAMEK